MLGLAPTEASVEEMIRTSRRNIPDFRALSREEA